MASLSLLAMRDYIAQSIPSRNKNRLRGTIAEIELRTYLQTLGYAGRVSRGGWIARKDGAADFGDLAVVLFPETILSTVDYPSGRKLPDPDLGLHTICATFHQSGVFAYFCAGRVGATDDPSTLTWDSVQLGLPMQQPYEPFPDSMKAFRLRARRYKYLQYKTDTTPIPDAAIPEEFSKEHLRVTFQTRYMAEVSDVDGLFWGRQFTYPLEIKEKTPANDSGIGDYFGLDVGPFVKLAFYAAKRGNLHSLFIVREIDNETDRKLVQWWFIPFERMAQYASWVPRAGGTDMMGGRSQVVRIPKKEFAPLDKTNLELL